MRAARAVGGGGHSPPTQRRRKGRCSMLTRHAPLHNVCGAAQQVEEYKYDEKKKPPYAYTYLIYHAIKDMQKEKVRP